MQPPKAAAPPPRSIFEYAKSEKFPWNVVSRVVQLNNGLVGEVIGNGHKFKFRVGITGDVKTFCTAYIVRQATQPAANAGPPNLAAQRARIAGAVSGEAILSTGVPAC